MSEAMAVEVCPDCGEEHAVVTAVACGGSETATAWERTTKIRPRGWRGRVYVDCCNRLELPKNTEARFETAFGGYVAGWYYRCAPDRGCNKNPGHLRTAHLRYYEWG